MGSLIFLFKKGGKMVSHNRIMHHFVHDQDELMIFLVEINKKRYKILAVERLQDDDYKYHVKYEVN